ncbi:MAG: site-specific DNA-methyltransferase [Candidatus Dojkabacteria bacterium]|jgi:adenine-specific DNA-methyltransferase|nr:site-specific DNA-methyltransferase [Candidatus Dojkabacteria bacterium]MDD4561208.1 site-specific DNA-methyltransferase [Candidatus Dojkabacteria bacterium]MDY0097327.1 site-specific DNA-methyltransferase [Candidatus Dojkabacteria bacterium]
MKLDNLIEKQIPESRLYLGDNSVVLKKLIAEGIKVDLTYIDPPFSTNGVFRKGGSRVSTISSSKADEIAYTDTLVGDKFLDFLRERIILIKEILSERGTLYLHIDTKVGYKVRALLDEVFGENRFISEITRIKCNPKNFSRKAFGNIKDVIYVYSKTEDYIWNNPREPFSEEDIRRLFPKEKDGRLYTTNPLHAPGETRNGETGKKWRDMLPPEGRHWRYPPSELEKLEKKGLIEWSSNGNPRKMIFADEMKKKGKAVQDVWTYKDPVRPKYPTEKNREMLELIVKTSSNPGSIVLDCFCGSGSTLLAANKLDRKFIGIDESKVAINTVIKQIPEQRKLI